MVAEIKGQDWNKEVVTSKDATNGGPDDAKRTEFYEQRSDLKTADVFSDIVGDLTTKGYKTLDDLKNTSVVHEIKAGNTLFPILKDYFAALPGMDPKQAEKETYLSLAFVMKENPGINVDDLKIGGKVVISDGYLSVWNPDGTTKTIDSKPLRPAGSLPVVQPEPVVVPQDPSVVPTAPTVPNITPEPIQPTVNPEPVAPVAPVAPVVPQDDANKEKVTPELPKVVVDPLPPVPVTPVVPKDLQDPTIEKPKNPDSVVFLPEEPKPEVKIDILAPSVPTYGPISKIDEANKVEQPKVEVPVETVKEISPALTTEQIEAAERVDLEKTVTEIQGKVSTLKLVPRKGFETNPYKSDGANIIFQNEKSWPFSMISDKPIHTVESPEKAAALVALLNVQYLPTAPVAPAEKPVPAPVVEVAPNENQKTLDFVKNTLKLKDPVAAESIKAATVTIDGVAVEGNQFDYKGGKVLISKDQKDVYFDSNLIDVAADVDQQIVDILSAR